MAIDLRAKIYCSLGKVISGNLSDSYLQGAGLVTTSGQVTLSGIYNFNAGTIVKFGYYQNGYISRIPRTLRVLSYFADPFRKETTVELGDVLVYLENRKPPLTPPSTADENSSLPCSTFQTVPPQISASYVFNQCLTALGLTSTGANLTNKFSVDVFDISAGYVSVMNDLLVSENQFGFLNENEVLVVRSFDRDQKTGPSIKAWDIIDVSGIGSGEVPGDAVAVNYSSLKLRTPDEEETVTSIDTRNWEYEKQDITNSDVEMTIFNNQPGNYMNDRTYRYKNYEKREIRNEYDSWNRKTKQVTQITKSIIVANPGFVESIINYPAENSAEVSDLNLFAWQISSMEVPEIEERYWTYSTRAFGSTDGCQYKEASEKGDVGTVVKEEYYLYQSEMGLAAAMSIPSYVYKVGNDLRLLQPSTSLTFGGSFLTKKQVIEYESAEVTVGSVASETTKTTTTDWLAQILTQQGQQMYAKLAESNIRISAVATNNMPGDYAQNSGTISESTLLEDFEETIARAGTLVVDNVSVENYYGYKVGLQIRPSTTDRYVAAFQSEDPKESVANIEWITGSSQSTNVITFNMPYAPDDKITYSSSIGYRSVASDAPAKARAYGTTQNKLLFGNRYGVSVQISASLMPLRPFEPVYVNVNGIMGEYRVNGASWTFDSSGIVASMDALFWGAVGAS